MRALKVLQLDGWMRFTKDEFPEEFHACVERRITPVFHRDGRYKLGNFEWFEIDGEAYVPNYRDLDFDLQILNHVPLRRKVLEALEALECERVLTREQHRLLHMDRYVRELSDIRRSADRFLRDRE